MKKIIVYVFLFLLLFLIISLVNILNTYFSERVNIYIENKGIVYTQNFIQDALMDSVIEQINIDSIYYIKEDNTGQVESVLINTKQVNQILGLVNKSIDESLSLLTEERLEIPFSIIFGETIFSSFGPNINLKIFPIGNYKCDVISEATQYGINNSLFEIFISVELNIETIVPLKRIESSVDCKIPIVMQIIQGEVPRYYYNTDKIIPDIYDANSNN